MLTELQRAAYLYTVPSNGVVGNEPEPLGNGPSLLDSISWRGFKKTPNLKLQSQIHSHFLSFDFCSAFNSMHNPSKYLLDALDAKDLLHAYAVWPRKKKKLQRSFLDFSKGQIFHGNFGLIQFNFDDDHIYRD